MSDLVGNPEEGFLAAEIIAGTSRGRHNFINQRFHCNPFNHILLTIKLK